MMINLSALAGTVFLFIMWPSFNAVLTHGSSRMRALPNTIFSLMGSVLGAFVFSMLISKKFDMMHCQNATLAGGEAQLRRLGDFAFRAPQVDST